MNSITLALISVFLPVATAAMAIVVTLLGRGRATGLLSVVSAAAALGCALGLFAGQLGGAEPAEALVTWLPHAGDAIQIGVRVDGLSASMLVVVCFVALCVQIFSLGYMAEEGDADFGRYFAWHSLFLFAMNSLVIAPNLLQLFMGWELVGLASYLLIGFYYKKPSAARAALKAFSITKLADVGFVAALIVLFAHTGSFSWQGAPTAVAGSVAVLLFIAVMGKSAQFPLHVWLPDAMEGPTPVSALLHAATMVAAGVYLVVRAYPLFEQAPDAQHIMLYVGSFTALFAAVVATVQNDIKRVLAYSTCSQLGYMVCALGAGSRAAGFFHLTTHAFFKALLFLAAGGLIHAVHSNDIRHMGGLLRKQRVTASAFIVGALALAGVPGLSGFFSKDLILEHVQEHGAVLPLLMLLTSAFLTALYMGRVIVIALLGEPSEHAAHAHEAGPSMTTPLLVLAVPALLAGYFVAPLTGLYGEAAAFHLSGIGGLASLLALAGLGSAFWLFGPAARGARVLALFAPLGRLARSGAVDATWLFAYRYLLRSLTALLAFIDRYIIDGIMNAIANVTLALGRVLRPLQSGNVQDYVYAVVIASLALGLIVVVFQ